METHQSQCCVLEQDTLSAAYSTAMVQPRKTGDWKFVEWDIKHQHEQTFSPKPGTLLHTKAVFVENIGSFYSGIMNKWNSQNNKRNNEFCQHKEK